MAANPASKPSPAAIHKCRIGSAARVSIGGLKNIGNQGANVVCGEWLRGHASGLLQDQFGRYRRDNSCCGILRKSRREEVMQRLTIPTVGFAFTLMVALAWGQGTPADDAAIRKAADQFPPAW